MSRLTFGAKRRPLNRGFFVAARFACGLFGLVGVIVFWALFASGLSFFVFVFTGYTIQTVGGTVRSTVHVFAGTAIFARGLGLVVLVHS